MEAVAQRQSTLVQEIATLDHIEEELTNDTNALKDLLVKHKCLAAEMGWATQRREQEWFRYLEAKGSRVDKWSNKLTGRSKEHDDMMRREEREYMNALQEEEQIRNGLEKMTFKIKELSERRATHQDAYERRLDLQKDLEELYDHLFHGPNPMYPQEDELEERHLAAQITHEAAQSALNLETETLSLLYQAKTFLAKALSAVRTAKTANKWDMLGNRHADLVEARELANANQYMDQYHLLFEQVQRLNEAVKHVQTAVLPEQSASDIMFGNPFSEFAMHKRYRAGVEDLDSSLTQMERVCSDARRRVEEAKEHAGRASDRLNKSRDQLNECRARLFSQILVDPSMVHEAHNSSTDDSTAPPPHCEPSDPVPLHPPVGPPSYTLFHEHEHEIPPNAHNPPTSEVPPSQGLPNPQDHEPCLPTPPILLHSVARPRAQRPRRSENPLLDRNLGLPALTSAAPVISVEPEQPPPWVN